MGCYQPRMTPAPSVWSSDNASSRTSSFLRLLSNRKAKAVTTRSNAGHLPEMPLASPFTFSTALIYDYLVCSPTGLLSYPLIRQQQHEDQGLLCRPCSEVSNTCANSWHLREDLRRSAPSATDRTRLCHVAMRQEFTHSFTERFS